MEPPGEALVNIFPDRVVVALQGPIEMSLHLMFLEEMIKAASDVFPELCTGFTPARQVDETAMTALGTTKPLQMADVLSSALKAHGYKVRRRQGLAVTPPKAKV